MDKEIYVARADLLRLDGKAVRDWNAALVREARTATAIIILGGYYNQAALLTLCRQVPKTPQKRRKTCRVRITVGLEGSAMLPSVWSELLEVKAALVEEGFRDVGMSVISRDPVHFHTKLFGFEQSTQSVWYVGSANPGSERHELMVRVGGRHAQLGNYAKTAYEKSLKVLGTVCPNSDSGSLRALFLAGVLYHKPPVQRLFTFDTFRFRPEDRAKLNDLFAQGARVTHARPQTEGFGFGLAGALGMGAAQQDESGDVSIKRIHYAGSAVDTALGFWMPICYRDELHANLRQLEDVRERHLVKFYSVLQSASGAARARFAFNEHVSSMTKFLAENSIAAKPTPHYLRQFNRFLQSRCSILREETGRRRHARLVIFTPMPDIWADERATRDFEDSFFEDLAYRAGLSVGNKGRVIRSLIDGMMDEGEPDTAEALRSAFESRLSARPWTVDDWLGQKSLN